MSCTLVLIDIGNTRATYGIYSGGRLGKHGSCSYSDIPKFVKNCGKKGVNHNIIVSISSVVPKITQKIKKSLRSTRCKIWVTGRDIPVPIRHKYSKKSKLGIDRLVNIYGAARIYRPPFLMIDFGTAITFDYVSKKGVFEGGMIVPGPETSFQALLSKAALIPKSLRLPEKSTSFLGRKTYDCIRSGTLEGYGALTDGLIDRFRARYGKKLQVIATGGFTKNMRPFSTKMKTIDPLHTLKSLLLLTKAHMKAKGLKP